MRILSLASGSKGNAYCVASHDEIIMIDCGLSCRELKKRFLEAQLDPQHVRAVLFTHNHSDHVSGLKTFHKTYPEAQLFANWMTAEAIARETEVEEEAFLPFENGQSFTVGSFVIQPFSIPHDVPDPVGYLIRGDHQTYFHATDVGTPLTSIGVKLAEADFATLESNHDSIMLKQSERPESLKQRIRGPRGHLSNDDAAELVQHFASPKLKSLALAHLSRDCNAPHLAERCMREALCHMKRTNIALSILSQEHVVEMATE